MAAKARVPLTDRIEREIEARVGVPVTVERADDDAHGAIALSGTVGSAAVRLQAEAIAARLAPGRRIENDIVVEPAPVDVAALVEGEAGVADLLASAAEVEALKAELELEPDFTDQPLETSGVDVPDEGDTVYFPPTDPVAAPDAHGGLEIVGGFSATSMDSLEVEPSAEDELPGDEALADAIRRELREDALTTDLQIDAVVRRGIAYLHGRVAGLDDAENAEEVASRVPGVREVVERLTVTTA